LVISITLVTCRTPKDIDVATDVVGYRVGEIFVGLIVLLIVEINDGRCVLLRNGAIDMVGIDDDGVNDGLNDDFTEGRKDGLTVVV